MIRHDEREQSEKWLRQKAKENLEKELEIFSKVSRAWEIISNNEPDIDKIVEIDPCLQSLNPCWRQKWHNLPRQKQNQIIALALSFWFGVRTDAIPGDMILDIIQGRKNRWLVPNLIKIRTAMETAKWAIINNLSKLQSRLLENRGQIEAWQLANDLLKTMGNSDPDNEGPETTVQFGLELERRLERIFKFIEKGLKILLEKSLKEG